MDKESEMTIEEAVEQVVREEHNVIERELRRYIRNSDDLTFIDKPTLSIHSMADGNVTQIVDEGEVKIEIERNFTPTEDSVKLKYDIERYYEEEG